MRNSNDLLRQEPGMLATVSGVAIVFLVAFAYWLKQRIGDDYIGQSPLGLVLVVTGIVIVMSSTVFLISFGIWIAPLVGRSINAMRRMMARLYSAMRRRETGWLPRETALMLARDCLLLDTRNPSADVAAIYLHAMAASSKDLRVRGSVSCGQCSSATKFEITILGAGGGRNMTCRGCRTEASLVFSIEKSPNGCVLLVGIEPTVYSSSLSCD
jgi:hypothetical protein